MTEAVRLRDAVAVNYASGVLSFTDRDIDLTVDLEIEDGTGLAMFEGTDAQRRINPGAPHAEDVIGVLRGAGLLEEGLSHSDIRRRQTLFQLNQLLDFVKEEVPFYRSNAYADVPLSALQQISSLPFLRKTDLRAHFLDLIPRQLDLNAGLSSGELTLNSTSGSTGERLQAVAGSEVAQNPAFYDQVWFGRHADHRSTLAVLTTPICSPTVCHLGRASYQERLSQHGSVLALNSSEDLFSIDRRQVEQFAAELERFRPDIFMFNPVYLHWFARRAREWGIALPPLRLLLSSYQYRSRLQTRGLRELLAAPIYDWYGCTEASAMVGQECPNGRLHVRAEQCLVEVVDVKGPVAPGTLGALVVTTIAARAMPLVRYLIGDVGSVEDSDCGCLLDGCPSIVLHGRAKDMLYLGERWVTTRQFDDVLGDTQDLDFYGCRQIDERTLRVEVIPALGREATFPSRELADRLGSRFSVFHVVVEVVRRLDPLPSSLKFALTGCLYREPPAYP
jgi:phenylacetate-CoA ligase